MAEEPQDRTRIFLTCDPLAHRTIPEVMAVIRGDVAELGEGVTAVCVGPEGFAWHRTRWAAQNYACQLRDARIRVLREELDRLERLDFGLKR